MKEKSQSIWIKLGQIDRRFLWLVLILVVAIPLYKPIGLPITITKEVKETYDLIESLQEGSVVVLNTDFTPGHYAEIGLQGVALLQHCLRRPIKIVFACFEPDAPMIARILLEEVNVGDKKYGVDYVIMPFIPGGEVAIASFAENVRGIVTSDYYGTPFEELPIMNEIKNVEDVGIWVVFSGGGGTTGMEVCARQIQGAYGTTLIACVLGVNIPGYYPYYTAGIASGFLGSQRAAAEYELLIKKPMKAVTYSDALSLAHLLVILLIVIGNISYLYEKYVGGK